MPISNGGLDNSTLPHTGVVAGVYIINALYYRFPLSLRDVRAGCLSDSLLAASTQTPPELAALNRDVRHLRDAIYSQIGGWDAPA